MEERVLVTKWIPFIDRSLGGVGGTHVVLVQAPGLHPLEIYQSIGVRAPPLGLAYIASVLEQEGHRVEIIDASSLELTPADTARLAGSRSPDLVGISSVTPTANGAYLVAKLLKERDPDLPVVMGGPHVTYMYEEALSSGADVVVRGEGELTMAELVEALEEGREDYKGIRGIAYRDREGRAVVTPQRPLIRDLDSLPEPARHLLPMDRYTLFDRPIRVIHVIASRGCPYGCIYCVTSYYWGRRYRIRDPRLVADEVERSVERYRTRYVVFTDDELTLIPRWMKEFTREIRKRGLDILWTCGSRVNSVSWDMLRGMAGAGCTTVYYGIESHSDRDLARIGKRVTVRQAVKAVSMTKKAGMEAAASFILGFPWQTLSDMKETVRFAVKLDPDYAQFTVATPYPGTPLHAVAEKLGLIEVRNWDLYTTMYPVMRGLRFTRRQVARILAWAYRYFYLRPRFLASQLRRGRIRLVLEVLTRILRNRPAGRLGDEERSPPLLQAGVGGTGP